MRSTHICVSRAAGGGSEMVERGDGRTQATRDGPTDEVLLSVTGLRTQFRTNTATIHAVSDVSFQVRRGETLGIVGESGSGKSVTARSIVGLVPPPGRVESGEIRFKGRDLVSMSESERQKVRGAEIAMVLQEPMTSLNPVLTIGDQITEMYRAHSERAPRAGSPREWAADLLRRVRIPDAVTRLAQYPLSFSGGMRQRVSIAMATACRPDLIIADEPTTALDVTIQAQILDLLRGLRDEFGMSIILITHDLGVVAELCDTVAVMYAGRIVEYADVETIFAQPRHPYTSALLGSLPRVGGPRLRRQQTIEGQPPDLSRPLAGCAFAPRCTLAEDRCHMSQPPESVIPARGVAGSVRCWVVMDELATGGDATAPNPAAPALTAAMEGKG